jgi:hypothetical protein
MKTTYAQQAAAAARNAYYENAHVLYARAAITADFDGNNAKSKRMWSQSNRYQRLLERDAD